MTMSLIGSLKYFDLIWNLTKGGPGVATELMATYMYKQSFSNFNMGYGSCVAAGMFILITLIALLFQRTLSMRKGTPSMAVKMKNTPSVSPKLITAETFFDSRRPRGNARVL